MRQIMNSFNNIILNKRRLEYINMILFMGKISNKTIITRRGGRNLPQEDFEKFLR